jgi:osmotically-inducible protein OsmY
MTRIRVCALLFLWAMFAFGQQQPQNPPPASPQATPDNPQTTNSQDKSGVNSQIQSNVASALSSDPALSGTDVQVSVDDVSITLTGSVQSQAQLDRVMALISPYQRYRNVVNKVKIH